MSRSRFLFSIATHFVVLYYITVRNTKSQTKLFGYKLQDKRAHFLSCNLYIIFFIILKGENVGELKKGDFSNFSGIF